ncbi:MAG TPA: hypothetical protein VFK30_03650, partial [Anaerolineae bacterium]|nr:hypothetical protein [Anaerolineae bacterium]
MNLKRIWIGLEAAVALALMGAGHYYVSTQRALYPIDGYVYYLLAVLLCLHLARLTRTEPDPVWRALAESFRAAAKIIWLSLRALLPVMSMRVRFAIVIAINILAAIFAIALPVNWWLVLWLGSIVLLLSPVLTRPVTRVSAPAAVQPWTEPVPVVDHRPNVIGLLVAIGALIAGQFMIVTPGPILHLSIADSINDALKLGLADPSNVLGGLLLLFMGMLLFGVVTRRNVVI